MFPPVSRQRNASRQALLGLVIFMLAPKVNAQRVTVGTTVSVWLDPTVVDFTFDPAKVNIEDVRRWIQLEDHISAENGFQVPPWLELCDLDDPRYIGCGKPQESLNIHNAQLNLEKIKLNITRLDAKHFPSELSPIVNYLRHIQSFSLQQATEALEFAQNGNGATLEPVLDKVDPQLACGAIFNRIRAAHEKTEAWKLVSFDWYNCLWNEEVKQLGPYPTNVWNAFLAARGIREHVWQIEVN